MDELKSRFDEAVEGIAPPPADVSRVLRGGRRQWAWRATGAIGGACVALVALVLLQAWSWLGPPHEPSEPLEPNPRWRLAPDQHVIAAGGATREWQLAASLREGRVCFLFLVEGGEGKEECSRRNTSWFVTHAFRPETPEKIVFGAAVSEAEVYQRLGNEDERPTPMMQAPTGFPGPERQFFVIIYDPTSKLELRIDMGLNGHEVIPPTPSFARYATRYAVTRRKPQEVTGVVEIDARGASICSTAYLPWARAAQIHTKVPRTDPDVAALDPVFITIFEPPTRFRATVCRDVDPLRLFQILDDPDRYYIDYHEKESGGKDARSAFELSMSDIDDVNR